MTLQNEERNLIVEYRLNRAKETIEEAQEAFELCRWNLVANRLYYALFYACSALLISKGHNASTHIGVKALINQHFVKNKILLTEEGRLLSMLFAMRQTGDYDDFYDQTRDDVEPLMPLTIELVEKISEIIKQNNSQL